MQAMIFLIAGIAFLISSGAYIYIKISMKNSFDDELDAYYWEFEEQNPDYARYLKWSSITFTIAVVSVLLIFLAAVL